MAQALIEGGGKKKPSNFTQASNQSAYLPPPFAQTSNQNSWLPGPQLDQNFVQYALGPSQQPNAGNSYLSQIYGPGYQMAGDIPSQNAHPIQQNVNSSYNTGGASVIYDKLFGPQNAAEKTTPLQEGHPFFGEYSQYEMPLAYQQYRRLQQIQDWVQNKAEEDAMAAANDGWGFSSGGGGGGGGGRGGSTTRGQNPFNWRYGLVEWRK